MNDHIFKSQYPGIITGKLSDITSLVCTPVLIVIFMLWITRLIRHPIKTKHSLLIIASLSALSMGGLMVMINVSNTWASGYEMGLGWVQWPWVGGWKYLTVGAWPPAPLARLTMDSTDIFTAPFAALSLIIVRRGIRRSADYTAS